MNAAAGEPTQGDVLARLPVTIEQRVRERAEEWFPDCGHHPAVRLTMVSSRPRSALYTVHLGREAGPPRILAKVRLPGGPSRPGARGTRPRLAPDQLPVEELTVREYDGLQAIHASFASSGGRFGTVRPLDLLAAENTILMEYVEAPTLRRLLLAEHRLGAVARSRPADRVDAPWSSAGAWLRCFQNAVPSADFPSRQARRQEVVDQFEAYGEFLEGAFNAPSVGRLARRAAAVAEATLPRSLELALGHGDFAPRNVFLPADGRLTVFDPLTRWAVPRYEDLCRFLVGIRLFGLHLHLHGAAYSRRRLDRLQRQVVLGYYGDDPVDVAQLRTYELLILLDKWSALADQASGGLRNRAQGTSLRLGRRFVERQAWELLALAENDAG